MALRTAYLAMHRRSDAAFARLGVTADQFVLMSAMADGHPATQRELADRTSSDPNTVRAMLILLEQRGLIARTPHPTDRRARNATLTPKGLKTHRALWAAGQGVRDRMLVALGMADAQILTDLLARLSLALADD
jgi:DNA-binding MarR family transcriptional regulator